MTILCVQLCIHPWLNPQGKNFFNTTIGTKGFHLFSRFLSYILILRWLRKKNIQDCSTDALGFMATWGDSVFHAPTAAFRVALGTHLLRWSYAELSRISSLRAVPSQIIDLHEYCPSPGSSAKCFGVHIFGSGGLVGISASLLAVSWPWGNYLISPFPFRLIGITMPTYSLQPSQTLPGIYT